MAKNAKKETKEASGLKPFVYIISGAKSKMIYCGAAFAEKAPQLADALVEGGVKPNKGFKSDSFQRVKGTGPIAEFNMEGRLVKTEKAGEIVMDVVNAYGVVRGAKAGKKAKSYLAYIYSANTVNVVPIIARGKDEKEALEILLKDMACKKFSSKDKLVKSKDGKTVSYGVRISAKGWKKIAPDSKGEVWAKITPLTFQNAEDVKGFNLDTFAMKGEEKESKKPGKAEKKETKKAAKAGKKNGKKSKKG